jgi:flagellar FliL protein
MAANRLDPTQGTDAAAAQAGEAAASPAPASAAGGFKAWLPLLMTVLLMPALAFAMTQFVLLPKLQKGLGITPVGAPGQHGVEKGGKETHAKREAVTMNKLLVNVAGTMGARYLLVSLNIVGAEAEFRKKMEDSDPQLRDMAMGVLSTKTIADLEKPGARNLIRTELIAGFNNILGGAFVKEMYMTEFAIQ